ncbi:MAG: symbB [Deltaproteobacteria bacterium]|nr:symbB [Deltaproteobacteria bacterium]
MLSWDVRFGLVTLLAVAGCGRFGFSELSVADAPGPDDSTDAVNPTDTTPSTDAMNPGDAIMFSCQGSYAFTVGTSRYRIAGTDQWLNSEVDCEADGAGHHLAVIDSIAELSALVPLVGVNRVWVGVTDLITEGMFVRVGGGAASFLPWTAGSPIANGPDCVSWDPATNQFRDEACNTAQDRVCECDGIPVQAGTY